MFISNVIQTVIVEIPKNVILDAITAEKHLNLMNCRLAHEHLFLVIRDLFKNTHKEKLLLFTEFGKRIY